MSSPTTPICALTDAEIETINEAMIDNMECRLVRNETSTELIYEPQRAMMGNLTIKLNVNRTIDDVWKLAGSLWAATNEPGT
ncbi:MAG: hypothetical protein K9N47_05670 [Prosthecobacter sp.]|uniref:hypothetical protein n=1 Tax=Prosthecobacter sp. TaxID=1965333 RepID=UPI0025EE5DB5|nr:hypothetical protein [Prosthecobacter sp.]MCF7785589.1 hypothetical protein [Prosthecobacter sp.]